MKMHANQTRDWFPVGAKVRCLDPNLRHHHIFRITKWMPCDIVIAGHQCEDCRTEGRIMNLQQVTDLPDPDGYADPYGVCILEDTPSINPENTKVLWEIIND